MSFNGAAGFNLEALKEPLGALVERRASELAPVRIDKLTSNDNGSGLSNETFFATATHAQGQSRWAIRCAPADITNALFPEYNIPRQFKIMKALHEHSDVPVTTPLWLEEDATLFGSPFFVMDFIAGDVPADSPPWQVSGFLVDGSDADRAKAWWSMVDCIAQIGKLDWRAVGLRFLADSPMGGASLLATIDYFERCYRSARTESVPFPDADRAIVWLRENVPADVEMGLIWGDAKPGNVIFRNYEPVALMDWELAGLGPPELDLANFLVYQISHETTINPDHARSRLPGFGSNAETIARFEQLIGRPVRDFDYYWAFAAFRYLALAQRYCNLVVNAGAMTREQGEAIKLLGGSMAAPLMRVVNGETSPALL